MGLHSFPPHRLRHVLVELARFVFVFKLDGTVGYPELVCQRFPDLMGNHLALGSRHVQNMNMAGHGMRFRPQTPDVNVMHLADPWNTQDRVRDFFEAHTLGQAFKQDIRRIHNDANGSPNDHSSNEKGQQRIDERLARISDQDCSGNDRQV